MRHLFLCETPFGLFNMLLVRTMDSSEPADIIFTDAADFTPYLAELARAGLFETIAHIHSRSAITQLLHQPMPVREQLALVPGNILDIPDELQGYTYSDLWLQLDSMCPKTVYYSLLQRQAAAPRIHFIEEGNASYYLNLDTLRADPFDHASYGERSFPDRCCDLWLYTPEAYQGDTLPVRSLPQSALTSDEFRIISNLIFQPERIPEERCIVFEQCFADDGNVTNDLELICHVGEIFGHDNVMVRLHPRTKLDRFAPFGFHTSGAGGLWEATLLANRDSLSDKVFVSIDSTASFSAAKLLHSTAPSLLLDRLVWGSYKDKDNRNKRAYFKELEAACNKQGMVLYRPVCMEELDLILEHIA